MRGKVADKLKIKRNTRITPAYAGKSVIFCFCCALRKDHPRVCGGKEKLTEMYGPCGRITPAYAGKSMLMAGQLKPIWDNPRVCGEKNRFTNSAVFA